MPSFKKDLLPSAHSNMTFKSALNNYSAFICQLVFMGPNLISVSKQTSCFSSLAISNRTVYRVGNGLIEHSMVLKETFYSNHLQRCDARIEFGRESFKKRLVVVLAKSGDVVGTFDFESFRELSVEYGYETEVIITLEDLLVKVFQFASLKSMTSNPFYLQPLPQTKPFARQDLLRNFVSALAKLSIWNRQFDPQLPAETNEFARNSEDNPKPIEKLGISMSSDDNSELQTSDVPDCIPMKKVETCHECREPIKMKKFFDERRFGIMEKCRCVICYGCIRRLVSSSNRVVKGPVRCPICFVISDNVASSSRWIQGREKDDFFEEYCKNVQNTDIKLKLGWTRLPSRKDIWISAL